MLVVIPNSEIILDRENYFNAFLNARERISNLNFTNVFVIFKEPLFALINAFLGLFFTAEVSILIIISLAVILSTVPLYNSKPELLLLIILIFLLPQVMAKYVVHLRQGLAMGLFFTMYFYFKRTLTFSFFLAGLIHISFFIVIPLAIVSGGLKGSRLSNLIVSVTILIFGWLILSSNLFVEIVSFFQVRQLDNYLFVSENVSGAGFLFWTSIFSILIFRKSYSLDGNFARNIVGIYLVGYFFIGFISRVLESFTPLIFVEVYSVNRVICFAAIVFYLIVSWAQMIGQPFLGFGVQ